MFRCFTLWLFLATSPALAETSPADLPSLTLPQAAQKTLERNPRLRSARFSRDAAAARVDEAAQKPQWSVGLDVEDVLGTGALSGFDASQTTLRLSRIFEPSGIRSGRVSVATAAGSRLDNALESERLDLMALLAERFLDAAHRQELRALADEAVEVRRRAAELAGVRVRAGAAPEVDRLRSEIRVADARLSLEDAEHELKSARSTLAATWGDDTADFGRVDASLCELASLPRFETLADEIERNPDLVRFATERRLREAEVRLADARRSPEWSWYAGVRHLEAIGDQGFVFGVTVPLGQSSRAEPTIRRADALQRRTGFEEQEARTSIRATLFALYQETLHTITEVETIEREILPRAEAILKAVEDGYALGRFSHIELVNAQSELLAARFARLGACTDHHRFLIDIERLTGGGAVWLAPDNGESP